jgi:hypothetical protein
MTGTLLRPGAAAGVLGVAVFFVATALHGGHDPGDLQAVLPEYAAKRGWLAVHLGQFAGVALMTGALVVLAHSLLADRPASAALARLGAGAAAVALAVYAATQAVDGVAIRFVADAWVDAAAPDKPGALLVAQAVRHVELGLTSLFELTLGVALVLLGLAVAGSGSASRSPGRTWPAWLGWAAVALGVGWAAVAVALAAGGFDVAVSVPAMVVTYLLGLWVLAVAAVLWRRAGR